MSTSTQTLNPKTLVSIARGSGPHSHAGTVYWIICSELTVSDQEGLARVCPPQGRIMDVLLDEPDRGARAAMLPEAFTPPPPSPPPQVGLSSFQGFQGFLTF